jgi:DNA-binding Lrp family transcriptional regulator
MRRIEQLIPDKKDMQILYWLDVNGRMSYSEIGKRIKLSKQLVKYRIERLEKERFIKGYFTMIDSGRLGFTTFRVYLKFRGVTPEKKNQIINYCKNLSSVWAVIVEAGKWDLALGISVREIYDFYEVWDDLLKCFLPAIHDYAVNIYSPIYHYDKKYLIDNPKQYSVRILGGRGKIELDNADFIILGLLSNNARVSLLDISEKIKMTPEAAGRRIRQLEKRGVIQGYRAMINLSKLGYEFYKVEFKLNSYDKIEHIISYCQNQPKIYQVDRTIGGSTLDVEFHVKNLQELYMLIEEFDKTFPQTVESFEYLTVLSEEKTTYMPKL